MASLKKKSNSLKIGKSVKVNKWLALGFVAAVVASAIVIVRYSGASSYIWSINSTDVDHIGGQKITKTDGGSTYWLGKRGDKVQLDTKSLRVYCIDGMFAEDNSSAKIGHLGFSNSGVADWSTGIKGNKGATFTQCHTSQTLLGSFYMEPTNGSVVFYRFFMK